MLLPLVLNLNELLPILAYSILRRIRILVLSDRGNRSRGVTCDVTLRLFSDARRSLLLQFNHHDHRVAFNIVW